MTRGNGTTASTRLDAILAGGTYHVLRDLHLPGVGDAKIRLLTRNEEAEITLGIARWLRDLTAEKITESMLGAVGTPLTTERAVRLCAIAVRDPEDPGKPFGSLDGWRNLPDVLIGLAFDTYAELLEELNPLAADAELTVGEAAAIADAIAKKNVSLLVSFGSRKLARFVTTTDGPPAS